MISEVFKNNISLYDKLLVSPSAQHKNTIEDSFDITTNFYCAYTKSKVRNKTADLFWRILNKSAIQQQRGSECLK